MSAEGESNLGDLAQHAGQHGPVVDVAVAAGKAMVDECNRLGVQLVEFALMVKIDDTETGTITVGHPADPANTAAMLFAGFQSICRKRFGIDFELPKEFGKGTGMARVGHHRPSGARGRGKRRPR